MLDGSMAEWETEKPKTQTQTKKGSMDIMKEEDVDREQKKRLGKESD